MHVTLLCWCLLAANGKAAPAEVPETPDHAVDRFTAIINDPHAEAARRAQAVQALGVLLGTTERMVNFSPNTEFLIGAMTGGLSELVFGGLLRKSVVPHERFAGIAQTLGQAFCDPAPEVRSSTDSMLHDADALIAVPAYIRGLSCPDATRAVAAVPRLADLLHGDLWRLSQKLPSGSDLASFPATNQALPALEAAARTGPPEVQKAAAPALAAAQQELDQSIQSLLAEAVQASSLEVTAEVLAAPVWGPAIRRHEPALRARLHDPNLELRRVAASSVWLMQGNTPAALDELTAHFWDGLQVPGQQTPEEKAKLEQGIKDAKPGDDIMTLHNAIIEQGPRASAGVPTMAGHLAGLLQNQGEVFLGSELYALMLIGPAAAPAVPEIKKCMKASFPGIRTSAIEALAFITHDPKLLPELHQDLADGFLSEHDRVVLVLSILALDPADRRARKVLKLGEAPLLSALVRRAIAAPEPALDSTLVLFAMQQPAQP